MAGENEVLAALEKIVTQLEAAKGDKIDAALVTEINDAKAKATEFGMKSGLSLISNLADKMKDLNDGKTTMDSVGIRVTALKFYLENIKKVGEVADL
jgi:hypothetical protein